ncbi:hypothetical protein U9M48_026633 [Paspalum notatum var. saurae]|uniref:F-box domain-containing protein n=1 Tax=Paspalum notatum var. saurae TaxID=547442 RepID=A0AAQ3WYG0_PASNO
MVVFRECKKTRKRKLWSAPEAAEAPRRSVPKLPDEILVQEILVRLPVKCLVRCRSVCKAWRSMVLDPLFVCAHLGHSASKWEQDPSLIINPITYGRLLRGPGNTVTPDDFSNHIRFYQWQQNAFSNGRAARFLHSKDFGSEFKYLCYFAHCDGLVLAPTDANLYLFNPTTRDSITLPNTHESLPLCRSRPRSSHRQVQGLRKMGMEVFTVNNGDGGGVWEEAVDDPPYPISLADEKFGVTRLPDSLDPALDDDSFAFQAASWLHGREQELWLMARTSIESVAIWTMPVDDDGGQGH